MYVQNNQQQVTGVVSTKNAVRAAITSEFTTFTDREAALRDAWAYWAGERRRALQNIVRRRFTNDSRGRVQMVREAAHNARAVLAGQKAVA